MPLDSDVLNNITLPDLLASFPLAEQLTCRDDASGAAALARSEMVFTRHQTWTHLVHTSQTLAFASHLRQLPLELLQVRLLDPRDALDRTDHVLNLLLVAVNDHLNVFVVTKLC